MRLQARGVQYWLTRDDEHTQMAHGGEDTGNAAHGGEHWSATSFLSVAALHPF